MNPLAHQLHERLGLSEEIATQASRIALDYIKQRLPEAVHPAIEAIASGSGESGGAAAALKGSVLKGALGDLSKEVGGLYGAGGDGGKNA